MIPARWLATAEACSLSDRMEATNGRSTGFDYLRIFLALSVILWHSFGLSYGTALKVPAGANILTAILDSILPMFFALSGFLVAGSLARNTSLVTFLGLRVLRIVPALAVEVLLSALILGPILTTATLYGYFTDARFYGYFLNMVGDIHYILPGLFQSNPFPDIVNGQLWTVPWELECYLVLAASAILGIVNRRALFLVGVLVTCAVLGMWDARSGTLSGAPLLVGFLCGVAIFQYRDIIPWDGKLAALGAAMMLYFFWMPGGSYILAGIPAAYLTVYLGLANPGKIALLRGADYSYGLYLYGFTIQQSVARVFPWAHHWYLNLLLAVPIASLFAALSWRMVEKPALGLRTYLPRLGFTLPRDLPLRPGLRAGEPRDLSKIFQ